LLAREAKIVAFEKELGILSDGSTVPLTLRQKIIFRNSDSRLQHKLSVVRKKTKKVIERLNESEEWETDLKDTQLIRSFVVECLSPFRRVAFNFAQSEDFRDKPSWFFYIFSWTFITGAIVFYFYWTFAWGVKNGGDTLKQWGSILGLINIQNIFLVGLTKAYLLQYLPAQLMQPQLRQIRSVLADVSMDYLNRRKTTGAEEEEEEGVVEDFRVIQHMSAACRASHDESMKNLPSAWLLRQVRF
jgi:hypothetical protein